MQISAELSKSKCAKTLVRCGSFGLVFSVRAFTGLDVPLLGPNAIGFPAELAPGGVSVSVNVVAVFGWPFLLAIAVVVLCIVARLYHRKIAKTIVNNLPITPTPPANESLSI